MKLSNFFDIQPLFKRCENYLKTNKRVSFAEKLLLSDKVPLNFKGEIMAKFKKEDQLKELGKLEGFQKLSDQAKIELYNQTEISDQTIVKLFKRMAMTDQMKVELVNQMAMD